MSLNSILTRQKSAIIKKWFTLVIETYPSDTGKFLKTQKDPFANPVGRSISQGLEGVFDELLGDMDYKTIATFLDPIIRIRAVQSFSPARAIGFIFFLKKAIRENLHNQMTQEQIADELPVFETKIDQLSLIAFNLYMQCREKIYELKANEMRNSTFKAFERAGLVSEAPDVEPALEPINITKEASNNY